MAITRTSRTFKDISLSFIPHPITKDLPVLLNENAIRRSVRNLVETIPTEVFFNSLVGSRVRRCLFELVDETTASVIQDEIKVALYNYEPRIANVKVEAIPRVEQNAFEVNIFFDIIGQEYPAQQFSFVLEATR